MCETLLLSQNYAIIRVILEFTDQLIFHCLFAISLNIHNCSDIRY